MAQKLTPEERAQRAIDRKAAKLAEREAAFQARHAQWEAERQATQVDFEANLTETDKAAIATILVPHHFDDDNLPHFESEFIGSLYTQYQNKGYLSPGQLSTIVRQYNRKLEIAAMVATWPVLTTETVIKTMIKVKSMEQRQGDYGWFWKIVLLHKCGRQLHINTTSKKIQALATACIEDGEMLLIINATPKWISPDNRLAVLNTRGLKVARLLE
jgi:hypothetical protein